MGDDIDDMLDSFKDIDRSIVEGAKNYRTLQASISKTNSLLTSKNWEIFSRFISGTGLWRVQNRIKAMVMFLNEMQDGAERRRIEEAKNLKQYAEIADNLEKAKTMQEQLQIASSGTAAEQEKALAYLREESQIFKGLEFQYGKGEKSLEKMGDLMERQVENAKKLQKIADKSAAKNEKGLKGIKARSRVLQSISKFTSKISETSEYNADIQKKIDSAGGANPIDKLDVSTAKSTLAKDGRMMYFAKPKEGGRSKQISEKQYKTMIEMQNYNKKIFRLRSKTSKVLVGEIAKPFKKVWKNIKSIAKGIGKLVLGMAKLAIGLFLVLLSIMVGWKLIEPYMESIRKALDTLWTVFKSGMDLVASGVGQVWTGLKDLYDAFVNMDIMALWSAFGTILGGIIKIGVGLLMMTLGALLAAGWTFITSAFADGVTKAETALGQVIAGVANVFQGILAVVAGVALVIGVIGIVVGAAFALPALIVSGIALVFWKAASLVVKHADEIAAFIQPAIDEVSSFLSWIGGLLANIKDLFDNLPSEIADFIGEKFQEAMDVGGKAKDKVKEVGGAVKGFFGLAEGGRISRGGLAIVGEEGPELVSLPTGAQVHSNSASKAMASTVTNNITVQVTGRVGASDNEIRDIANKVAREINSRMNRTATSVVKF